MPVTKRTIGRAPAGNPKVNARIRHLVCVFQVLFEIRARHGCTNETRQRARKWGGLVVVSFGKDTNFPSASLPVVVVQSDFGLTNRTTKRVNCVGEVDIRRMPGSYERRPSFLSRCWEDQ